MGSHSTTLEELLEMFKMKENSVGKHARYMIAP